MSACESAQARSFLVRAMGVQCELLEVFGAIRRAQISATEKMYLRARAVADRGVVVAAAGSDDILREYKQLMESARNALRSHFGIITASEGSGAPPPFSMGVLRMSCL